jgi:hypothetical protein
MSRHPQIWRIREDGIDPIERRRAERAEAAARAGLNTFAEVADAYVTAHEASWRNAKHRQQWRNTLDTYATPVLGDLGVAMVDTGAVMRVLEPIWREKPETASRLRGRIEPVLDYVTARGWRTGENPARWRGHVDNLLPARVNIARVEHHAALPWRELGAFMADLAKPIFDTCVVRGRYKSLNSLSIGGDLTEYVVPRVCDILR